MRKAAPVSRDGLSIVGPRCGHEDSLSLREDLESEDQAFVFRTTVETMRHWITSFQLLNREGECRGAWGDCNATNAPDSSSRPSQAR